MNFLRANDFQHAKHDEANRIMSHQKKRKRIHPDKTASDIRNLKSPNTPPLAPG